MKTEKEPTPKDLRIFGFGVAAMLLIVFMGVMPWIFGRAVPRWPLVPATLLAVAAALAPMALRRVRRVWSRAGEAIGWAQLFVLLSALFAFVVTPIAIARRALGREPIPLKPDPSIASYRIPRHETSSARSRMERPF